MDRGMKVIYSDCSMKYLCVLDFEATCNEKGSTDLMEIIEFPSVLYNLTDEGRLIFISEFHEYVKPVIHPRLTKFCTDLTGIKQETVDQADIFINVYNRHFRWLQENTDDVGNVCFVTCGHWDLATQLPRELKNKNIQKYYAIYKKYVNIKKDFELFYRVKGDSMINMIKHLGLDLGGRHHSGIDDTRNIAKILIRLTEDGYHKFMVHCI